LGCALGLRKRQKICRSSNGSSIGSCSIGCCGGVGSVRAAVAGCTLTVGAAGRGLVGAGGELRLCPCGLHYALAARALPSHLGLCPPGLGFTLAACATPSRLALCPCGLGCGGGGGGGGGSGSDGGKCLPSRLALRACRLGLCPCGLALPTSHSRLALRARGSARPNTTIKQQSSGRKSCFGNAAAYLPQR
jgi:hypothetical protein